MRIISRFHDYYDSVQAYGQDERCVYVRNTETTHITNRLSKYISKEIMFSARYWGDTRDLYEQMYIVGFCGKAYPLIRIVDNRDFENPVEGIVYNMAECTAFMESLKKYDISRYYKSKKRNFWQYDSFNVVTAERFFANVINTKRFNILFYEHKTPIWVIELDPRYKNARTSMGKGYEIQISPKLAKLKFYRAVPTFLAYQEIDMYISGVLGLNTPNMVEVSDDKMRDKKGFNKYSFKNHP